MSTTNIAIGLIVLALIGGLGWYFVGNQDGYDSIVENSSDGKGEEMMEKGDGEVMDGSPTGEGGKMMKDSNGETMMETSKVEEEAMMAKSGSYEAYSPEKIARAKEGKVVLFFRASWCPTCRALDSNIRANLEDIPGGLSILHVDYDNSTALKQKYGVTYQHTLVQVDASGNQITKWTGGLILSDFLKNVR